MACLLEQDGVQVGGNHPSIGQEETCSRNGLKEQKMIPM